MAERHIVDVIIVRLWHAPAFTSGEYQQDGDDGVNGCASDYSYYCCDEFCNPQGAQSAV
ncbi:hypothetical protein A79_1783 [Vibrio parahaemolyticus AQ3810]|nr:hypothetical protein A79_1783 [Vibrio parahaemolyticus AQ3810]